MDDAPPHIWKSVSSIRPGIMALTGGSLWRKCSAPTSAFFEETRLAIEKQRLEVGEKRLKVEQERLELEKTRMQWMPLSTHFVDPPVAFLMSD